MRFKDGVELNGIRASSLSALAVVDDVARQLALAEPVCTSALDGKHRADSLHYSGRAVDIRTRDYAPADVDRLLRRIRIALGPQFDVIYENPDPARRDDGEHIHIEWDPR